MVDHLYLLCPDSVFFTSRTDSSTLTDGKKSDLFQQPFFSDPQINESTQNHVTADPGETIKMRMHHLLPIDKISYFLHKERNANGSAQLTGEAPGLQIRCGALIPSRVGSIPMHFRHFFFTFKQLVTFPKSPKSYYKATTKTTG
jgi:hypothetical protein